MFVRHWRVDALCFLTFSFGVFMSKRSIESYFRPPPSPEEAQAWADEWRLKSLLRHPTSRRSKLEPFIPFIATLLKVKGGSLKFISNRLLAQHQVEADKSTLCRFIRKHPFLRDLKPMNKKLSADKSKEQS